MLNAPKTIKLYNTLTRSEEVFTPSDPQDVRLYCCGPTVYNYAHIGNLRAYLFEDLLVRTLRQFGYKINHVMNITDVGHLTGDDDSGEDKMAVASRREGKRSYEIAEYYTKAFLDDETALNITRPNIICKASEHIPQMIEMIQQLEKKGFAYVSQGNVYFDIQKSGNYGCLACLNLESLQAGARIDVDDGKRHPLDFALWFTNSKFSNQELQWDSPWGRGYPGWHIECSAMAIHYLGETLDIHCGGIDHIPVHHTNEIAQSEGATGKLFSKLWMHGEFLVVKNEAEGDGEKMSKSKGGFLRLQTLIDAGHDPIAYRLFCLGTSYRQQLTWSWEALTGAGNSLKRIRNIVLDLKTEVLKSTDEATLLSAAENFTHPATEQFHQALADDLNAPQALAVFYEILNSQELDPKDKLTLLYHFDLFLGLGLPALQEIEVPSEILQLAQQRADARTRKDFKESDRLRNELTEKGYIVEDSRDGTWKVKKV